MNLSQIPTRQKILAGILVGTIVLMWGVPTVWGIVVGPFSERYSMLASLDNTLQQKKLDQRILENAEARLKDGEKRSLPSDPSSLAYQVWLTDLAKKHDFNGVSVSPKTFNRNGSEPFSRIRFAVSARCHMKELSRFLYDFYRANLLHKVVSMSIKSLDSKTDPELDLSLDIEGISLKATTKRDTLFLDQQEQVVAKRMKDKDFSLYEQLYAKNRFVRGYNGPPKPTTPPPPPAAPFDSSPYIKYVGFVESDGNRQGWLFDQSTNKTTELKPDSEFEVTGTKATVVELAPDYLVLRIREKNWRLEQGDSLKQMKELGSDGKPLSSPASLTNSPQSTSPTATSATNTAAATTDTTEIKPPSDAAKTAPEKPAESATESSETKKTATERTAPETTGPEKTVDADSEDESPEAGDPEDPNNPDDAEDELTPEPE